MVPVGAWRDWWRSLERAPEPLTRQQIGALIAATLIAAVSRVFALARAPWDWDELLFMLSLDHFDVALHRPHPPGFPLYVFSAKIIRKLGFGDFHALQALSFLGAITIVPAMFFLCRELRMRPSTSICAAMLLAFFPNVWFYGGGAFSDVPSMTLIVVAVALILAGCRDQRAFIAGAAILAIAAGFRPQNLAVGVAPFVIAATFRKKRVVLVAIVMITIVMAMSYGAAAWLTGWSEYRLALQIHRHYIARVDSFLSPVRPPLWRVFDDFFVMPYHAPVINAVIGVLALLGLVRLRPPVLAAVAAFGPLCIVSWLILDRFSASRFSIGYAPLVALLAAQGLQWITRDGRIEAAACAAIVAYMIVRTWPALAEVRRSIAPPVAAVDWIRNHIDSRRGTIFVDIGMVPFAEWYLPDYQLRFLGESQPPPTWSLRRPGYLLREEARWSPHAANFSRPHGRLWQLVRQRYFDASIRPVDEIVTFGNGWYEEESGGQPWRWMAARSEAILPPMAADARLSLSLYVPLDALGVAPNVTVRVNGVGVDHFRAASKDIERDIVVHALGDRPNELTIETDRTVVPAAKHLGSDTRNLGLRLNSIGWMRAR